ncbi:MAG TPA: choice-of-anchor J domain-containing protein [Bacteroidales bacterium]|nr:choice-of-anchor J domain-containing protein [Bacteroidales bacterium]
MKKIYVLFALIVMSGVIFAQSKRVSNSPISSKEIVHVMNQQASPKAIIDSLHYDGDPYTAIGTNAADTFAAFAFFPASMLSAHHSLGNTITKVKVYINGVTTVTSAKIKFYSNQTTEVLSQPFTAVEGWNVVTLTTPFAIPATDLYIGYEVIVTGGYPLGCDQGPVNTNANWLIFQGAWYHLTDLSASLTYNWNIRAMVDGTALTTPIASCTPATWDAGTIANNTTTTSTTFTLSNVGGGTMTASAVNGLSGTPFTCSLVPASVNLAAGQSTGFTFTYAPTTAGTHTATATIVTNGGDVTVNLTGTAVNCTAINSFPWVESFEGTTFAPECWSNLDVDGDTYKWETRDASNGWNIFDGNVAAVSASWVSSSVGAVTPNNYLITPQLAIANANMVLKCHIAPQDPLWPAEYFGVEVSTTGNTPANFTSIYNYTLTAADSVYKEVTLPLAAYNGQNIYIAFRHYNCTDNFYLLLDKVEVYESSDVNTNAINSSVFVYPNPVSTTLTVANDNAKVIEIYNLNGQKVAEYTNTNSANVANLAQGTYMVKVVTNNNVINQKINIVR